MASTGLNRVFPGIAPPPPPPNSGETGMVTRGVGFSGVLTDPIHGVGCSGVWGDYVIVRLKFLGIVQITGKTLSNFRQKVSCPYFFLAKEDIVLDVGPTLG
ncbi:unnamed protein product [Prunus brigantina]